LLLSQSTDFNVANVGFERAPRSTAPDHSGLDEADDRFGQRVVVRIAPIADGSLDADVCVRSV